MLVVVVLQVLRVKHLLRRPQLKEKRSYLEPKLVSFFAFYLNYFHFLWLVYWRYSRYKKRFWNICIANLGNILLTFRSSFLSFLHSSWFFLPSLAYKLLAKSLGESECTALTFEWIVSGQTCTPSFYCYRIGFSSIEVGFSFKGIPINFSVVQTLGVFL